MNRREFISLLTDSLVGRVPNELVSEKADYYREYISETALKSGKSEEAVIEEIGPPEAIAHTIVDRYEAEFGPFGGYDHRKSQSSYGEENVNDTDEAEASGADTMVSRFFKLLPASGCMLPLIILTMFGCALLFVAVRVFAAYPALCLVIILLLIAYGEYKKRHWR